MTIAERCHKRMRFLFIIPVMLVLAAPLGAQDFAKGLQAFEAGDFAAAVKEWKPLAESGDSSAQNSMGNLYYNGQGVPQNHAEAFRWYRLSAQQGNVDGQGNLGWMFEYGLGVAQDFSRAAKWYKRAADQGDGWAQNSLGVLYYHGQGVQKDFGQAFHWYKLAAAQGQLYAHQNLGWMYEHGEFVDRNLLMAFMWYDHAATRGLTDAAEARDSIGTRLSYLEKLQVMGMSKLCMGNAYKDCGDAPRSRYSY